MRWNIQIAGHGIKKIIAVDLLSGGILQVVGF